MTQRFSFRPIDVASATAIVAWRYPGRHAQYDACGGEGSDPRDDMLRPELRFFAVESGCELVGFCSFGADGRVPGWSCDDAATDVGAGLRPDLTGGGRGGGFLSAVVAHGRGALQLGDLRATIASWNQRALRAAATAGFRSVESFSSPNGNAFTLLVCHRARH